VEHNTFCVSAHFRNCPGECWQDVVNVAEEVVASNPELRITRGRKVVEVRPKVGESRGEVSEW
jgi:trehalose 6-phosphate phosphatase